MPRNKFAVYTENGVTYVFHNGPQPEIKVVEVEEDGKIIDIGGTKHRFHLV